MSSSVAFSITWVGLEALRSMPRQLPDNAHGLRTDLTLLTKGLAELRADLIVPCAKGEHLLHALVGLAQS
jgi:hypothetical protein